MSAALPFDKHIFISYAHIDNQPLSPEQLGWVTRFHASLQAMLSMRLGYKAEIWRDDKLRGNDLFGPEIVAQFPKTALLISVLTPRYVHSDWCTKEVREFCSAADHNGGVLVENKSRILKVIKTPVDSEQPLPPLMQQMLGYEFYTIDDDHTPLELDPVYGAELAQKFNLKMAKLAWDVAQMLKELERAAPAAAAATTAAPVSDKPAIYLAECSYDRREARDAIDSELRLRGYRVLPDRQLPGVEDQCIAEIARLLSECRLSVHIIGNGYGDGPGEKSVVVLQNELAIERARAGELRRIIWLPQGTTGKQPEQQRFIEDLHGSAQAQFGADLITADLEVLKGAIQSALRKIETPVEPAPAADGAALPLVYVLCDQRDRAATLPLRKFLKAQGLDAKLPVFEGDAAAVRQANQELLTQCDGVVLFYGAGDEAWKRSVDQDLRKAAGFRGGKPIRAVYTYLAEPATDDKKDMIELGEDNLIDGLAGFAEPRVAPLVAAVRGAAGASA